MTNRKYLYPNYLELQIGDKERLGRTTPANTATVSGEKEILALLRPKVGSLHKKCAPFLTEFNSIGLHTAFALSYPQKMWIRLLVSKSDCTTTITPWVQGKTGKKSPSNTQGLWGIGEALMVVSINLLDRSANTTCQQTHRHQQYCLRSLEWGYWRWS